MSKTIYDQHDAAFRYVGAHVIMHSGERVATIAFKFPKDGAGRLNVFIHWIGMEMVRGYAGGYGYDKQSAACENASRKLKDPVAAGLAGTSGEHNDQWVKFKEALTDVGGSRWNDRLREAGFTVLSAI